VSYGFLCLGTNSNDICQSGFPAGIIINEVKETGGEKNGRKEKSKTPTLQSAHVLSCNQPPGRFHYV
jgi:hypothetical protein